MKDDVLIYFGNIFHMLHLNYFYSCIHVNSVNKRY